MKSTITSSSARNLGVRSSQVLSATPVNQTHPRHHSRLGGRVLNLTVQPEHVHLFVEMPPTLAPRQVMHRVKGATSHQLRQEFPHLRSQLPSVWTRSYLVKTVGRFDVSDMADFVAAQARS